MTRTPSISDPKPGAESRSPEWPKARAAYLKDHPTCEACGDADHIEVHHRQPFHLRADLELDPSNFIALCEHPERACHFALGHLLDWRAFNPDVEQDAATYLAKVKVRPYG